MSGAEGLGRKEIPPVVMNFLLAFLVPFFFYGRSYFPTRCHETTMMTGQSEPNGTEMSIFIRITFIIYRLI